MEPGIRRNDLADELAAQYCVGFLIRKAQAARFDTAARAHLPITCDDHPRAT